MKYIITILIFAIPAMVFGEVDGSSAGGFKEALIGILTGAETIDGNANGLSWIIYLIKGSLIIGAIYFLLKGIGLLSKEGSQSEPMLILWGIMASILSLKWDALVNWTVDKVIA